MAIHKRSSLPFFLFSRTKNTVRRDHTNHADFDRWMEEMKRRALRAQGKGFEKKNNHQSVRLQLKIGVRGKNIYIRDGVSLGTRGDAVMDSCVCLPSEVVQYNTADRRSKAGTIM